MSVTEYQPIIIIGAARSGTNILRDCLVSLDGFSTWPCDEINYIWRHGNRSYPNDEFPPELASDSVKAYLRNSFDKQAKKTGCRYLVEKTTANSLRLDFVRECFPNAKYIIIYRDGMDSIASAMIRWRAPLDLPYILKKARYVPLVDIPFYSFKYFMNRIYKLVSRKKTLAEWGPKPAELQGASLAERAAVQWAACVRATKDSIEGANSADIAELHYEDFVKEPGRTVGNLLAELSINLKEDDLEKLNGKVHKQSVNKGRQALNSEDKLAVEKIIKKQLDRLGYAS